MSRRTFIQRIVYALLAIVFGPDVLARLDRAAAEHFIDDLDRRLHRVWRVPRFKLVDRYDADDFIVLFQLTGEAS